MSRIGKRPIPVPSGVSITPKDGGVEVKGPRGVLYQRVTPVVAIDLGGGEVKVTRKDESRQTRALHGLTRALLQNMITGVTAGFRRQLEIIGVGYKAEVQGGALVLALGFSHPVRLTIPKGLTVKAERPTLLTIEGADKQVVGEFASEVRGIRPPEPYKGKGVKYVEERIRRKVGKTAATAGGK
jgi:large subunit ribosomal protein L6